METGDARFLKGHYVYKKVPIDENEKEAIRSARRSSVGSLSSQGSERRL